MDNCGEHLEEHDLERETTPEELLPAALQFLAHLHGVEDAPTSLVAWCDDCGRYGAVWDVGAFSCCLDCRARRARAARLSAS